MSHGGLEGKFVAHDFWPACENCVHFHSCATQPHHPAYPHTWHWGREHASFTDGALILRSWVGTAEIGQPHTGCQHYEVAPAYVAAPLVHHQRYFALEQERQELNAQLAALERGGDLDQKAEQLYTQLSQRFTAIIAEQRALQSQPETCRLAAA
jgi:hypothetical protein